MAKYAELVGVRNITVLECVDGFVLFHITFQLVVSKADKVKTVHSIYEQSSKMVEQLQ